MEHESDLYKSLTTMVARLESLLGRANSAMETMTGCPNCRHDTSVLLDGMGCIGTDIENAKKVIAAYRGRQ